MTFTTSKQSPREANQTEDLDQLMAMPQYSQLTGAYRHEQWAFVRYQAGQHQLIISGADPHPSKLPLFSILAHYKKDDGQAIYNVRFSPDDRLLAYVRGGDPEFPDDPPPNPTFEPAPPQPTIHLVDLEQATEKTIAIGYQPVFSPDNSQLVYVSQDQLWQQSLKEASPPRKLLTVKGHIRSLSWSSDGKHLVFTDDRTDHSFIALYDLSMDKLTYLPSALGNDLFPVFSPDNKKVAFIRAYGLPPTPLTASISSQQSSGWWSIMIADLEKGSLTEQWKASSGRGNVYAGTRHQNLFWTDKNALIFPWEKDGWLHVYSLNLQSEEVRLLTRGDFEVEQFLVDNTQNRLIYTSNTENSDRYQLWERSLSSEKQQLLGDSRALAFQPVLAKDQLAALVSNIFEPPYPVRVEQKQFFSLVKEDKSELAKNIFSHPETVRFPAEDGKTVYAQFFPAHSPLKKQAYPTVIFIHGGPRRQMLAGFPALHYYENAYIFNQWLTTKGYNILSVNYRGGTGYGHDYREAPETGRQGASEYQDILGAAHYLQARKDVDSNHIALWGGSWGGYLTALALARNSDLFKVGIDFHGVHNMLRPPPDIFSPEEQAKAREDMWQSSPLSSLNKWHSPILLIHGDDDHNVPFYQSEELAKQLKIHAIRHEDISFPNERHGFLLHHHWLEAYHHSFIFLEHYLPVPADH
ncbi:MAG: prolyl oligopeptidase family serine peptidase [Zymomonas mobilis subsp. pomaceae]|uniref:S9 family peptidase n=1 Tax=Zymomonas mobilis TaxID=542 RepID=UPI00208DB199|nr:prolyl oligopeptidase family serine peptidase [Zymomonas mobilis]MDX5948804.1 prolyl oligopeptidase family serine peptidase [Zymomonas mobilis subsp. pomaceae]